jgi:DNA-binding phage protein
MQQPLSSSLWATALNAALGTSAPATALALCGALSRCIEEAGGTEAFTTATGLDQVAIQAAVSPSGLSDLLALRELLQELGFQMVIKPLATAT